jgi:hypothetical protein
VTSQNGTCVSRNLEEGRRGGDRTAAYKADAPSIMLNADIIEERPYISMATFYRPPQEVVPESSKVLKNEII